MIRTTQIKQFWSINGRIWFVWSITDFGRVQRYKAEDKNGNQLTAPVRETDVIEVKQSFEC